MTGSSCKKNNEIQPLDPFITEAAVSLESLAAPADSMYHLKTSQPGIVEDSLDVFSLPDGFSLQHKKRRQLDVWIGPFESEMDIKK